MRGLIGWGMMWMSMALIISVALLVLETAHVLWLLFIPVGFTVEIKD